MGSSTAGEFDDVRLSCFVRHIFVYRLRDVVRAYPSANSGLSGCSWNGGFMTRSKRIIAGLAALCLAGAIWIPCLHLFFKRPASNFYRSEGLSPMAKKLAARHLQLWTDSNLRAQELEKMRASNARIGFMMGRTFFVWSLANMSLREPGRKGVLPRHDRYDYRRNSAYRKGEGDVFLFDGLCAWRPLENSTGTKPFPGWGNRNDDCLSPPGK